MKKISILSIIVLIASLIGCDYNDEHFPGYDSAKITDVGQYDGVYAGDYPADGYFTDKTAVESAINTMLKDSIKYADKGYTASISVMYGDVTPGFSREDVAYTLAKEDYDSMGEENGQPGKFDNFDDKMDIDGYLIDFITGKYASLEQGKIVSITYMFYATGAGTNAETNSYQKEANGWHRIELNAFTADISYEMVTEDYDAMGTESGKPGRYDNFDSNMDVDHYISIMLNQKYPYALENATAQVTYLFYSGSPSNRSSYYKVIGTGWTAYDPYADIINVTAKIAEMEFNGSNWILNRLLGGSMKYALVMADYEKLTAWVKVNKPAYMAQNGLDDYYFGASHYGNLNNKPSTWKDYYNINGEYDGKSDDEMYDIMDARIAEGIINIILPDLVPNPDTGLSYQIIYDLYGGGRNGTGLYMQAFMYNEDEGKFEVVSSAPIKQ